MVPFPNNSFREGASMDAALNTQLSIAALVCSALALLISLLAAFPGLKLIFAVIRDGVLWLALLLVLGGVSFVVWQHVEKLSPRSKAATLTAGQAPRLPESQ